MKVIRNGVFETNSSSTHSIILTEGKTRPGLSVNFAIGEFGWEWRKLASTDEKASYLYTLSCELLHRDTYQDFYNVLTKYGVECSCSEPAKFDTYLENGYVDHATDGETKEFVEIMMNHEKSLIKFLFSDESFIVTGNDNCYEREARWFEEQCNVNYPHKEFYKGN